MKHRRYYIKTFLKLYSLLLLIFFAGVVALFLIYPHYNKIILLKNSLNTKQLAHNATLKLITSLSPIIQDSYAADFDNAEAVEYISPEKLIQLQNEGKIAEPLEPHDTRLQIQSVNIDALVRDGVDANTMDKGPWHFPLSVAPGEQGNFTIIGHRFGELPPSTNTFFNLDKVKIGDKINIKQKGDISYTYTVVEKRVVEKTDRSVLLPTNDHRITLITCTPLWTSKQRLAVIGILDKIYRKI